MLTGVDLPLLGRRAAAVYSLVAVLGAVSGDGGALFAGWTGLSATAVAAIAMAAIGDD